MTTAEIVDQNLELVEGLDRNDPIIRKRWTHAVQRAVNLIWDDRPWSFKLAQDLAFVYTPATDVDLPSDFGSFETKGAGVYCLSPKACLQPIDIGELNMLKLGSLYSTQAVGPWTKYSVGNQTLELWPEPASNTNVGIVYLKRAPRCVYFETADELDELSWIPTRWHDLVSDGAERFMVGDEDGVFEAGLVKMRERENWTAGFGRMVPYRRNRMNAS